MSASAAIASPRLQPNLHGKKLARHVLGFEPRPARLEDWLCKMDHGSHVSVGPLHQARSSSGGIQPSYAFVAAELHQTDDGVADDAFQSHTGQGRGRPRGHGSHLPQHRRSCGRMPSPTKLRRTLQCGLEWIVEKNGYLEDPAQAAPRQTGFSPLASVNQARCVRQTCVTKKPGAATVVPGSPSEALEIETARHAGRHIAALTRESLEPRTAHSAEPGSAGESTVDEAIAPSTSPATIYPR